jgi:biotin transporter BioY
MGFVVLLGAVVLGVIAGDDTGAAWALFVIVAIPGALMVTVGVVAKAVQIGIRSARD